MTVQPVGVYSFPVTPYVTVAHALLVEWVHYVPVADNLADLPERVAWAEGQPAKAAQVAAAGRLFAARLHAHEIACFWWQLLTAVAPLQDFEARLAPGLGFARVKDGGVTAIARA